MTNMWHDMKIPTWTHENFTSTFSDFLLKSFLLQVFQLIMSILEGELRPLCSMQNHMDETASPPPQKPGNRRQAGEKIGKMA